MTAPSPGLPIKVPAAPFTLCPADDLRQIASKVRRLSIIGPHDIDASFVERDELARALCRIAAELEQRL